jgi:hypothetical protein
MADIVATDQTNTSAEFNLNVEILSAFVAIVHPFVLYPIELDSTLALPSMEALV